MADGRADLGPTLPPRGAVHAMAVELEALARRAAEFSGHGPTADLAMAVQQFERMRLLLGRGQLPDDDEIGGAIDV